MILSSRYTWMWPWVGTMCVVVGFTMWAPCSDTTRCRDVPWITAPLLGDTIAMVAGLLDLADGVAVGDVPDPLFPPPQAVATTAIAHRAAPNARLVFVIAPILRWSVRNRPRWG